MKRTNKVIWSFLALTLFITACQEQRKKEIETAATSAEEQITYEAPKQIISLEEADSLYVNYKDRRATNIVKMEAEYQEDGKPFVPTQFVSFDIEVLKEYIGYVEQEAKKGGVKADSLRIYLGNYGKEKKKNARRNTVFILPAAEVDGDYGGIYIAADGKAKLIRDWIKAHEMENDGNQKSKASFFPGLQPTPALYDGGSLTLNRGTGGPPPNGDF